MSKTTFFKYLTEKDLQSILTITAKKKDFDSLIKQFFKELSEKKITSTKARNLWTKAIENLFFNEFQRVFRFTPTDKYNTSTKLKNDLQKNFKKIAVEDKMVIGNSFISKIKSNPLHYLYSFAYKDVRNFESFLKTSLEDQLILSIFPKLGCAVYWPIAKDKRLKFITKVLKSSFEETEEIAVNALLLRKYAIQETITKLGISTPQEIAGFAGLDVIEFRGENVMLGLSGLKRRHDANVDVITRVGPFTEIESSIIKLICGKGILFKDYKALEALLKVLKGS